MVALTMGAMNKRRVLVITGTIVAMAISAIALGARDDPPAVFAGTEAAPTTATSSTTTSATTTPSPKPTTITKYVTTDDGWHYAIIFAADGTDPAQSQDRCVPVADPGHTNLTYAMRVLNLLTDRPAPAPYVQVDVNLLPDGVTIDNRPRTGKASFHAVDGEGRITIAPNDGPCFLNFTLSRSSGGHPIPAGGYLDFVITAGPVVTPVPDGTKLLVMLENVDGHEDGFTVDFDPAMP